MKKTVLFLLILISSGMSQTWEIGQSDSVVQIHDFFVFSQGKPIYMGNATDSSQVSIKLARLVSRGFSEDSIRVFFHWHYLTPDSSNTVLRNFNIGLFQLDTLGGQWYDKDFWDIIIDGLTLFYEHSQ